MKVLALLWLLMTTLIGDSIQECTTEQFEMVAIEFVSNEITETSVNVTVKEIYYNCLSTSEEISSYSSMSVSLIYNISSDPDTERDIRYNMLCVNREWRRFDSSSTPLRSNVTRTDCYLCLNTTVNDDHCSCE